MTPTTRNTARRVWALIAAVVLVAACSGAAPAATTVPAAPTAAPVSAGATTPAPATAALATAGPVTAAPATAPPATAAPATAAPATVEPATPAPPTSAPSSPPRSGPARVDLAFTKTRVFFAEGSEGTCRLTKVDGVTRFWFEATAAEYGAFGERFTVKEVDGKVVIEWVIDANTLLYANNPNVVIKISDNHRKVTLNQDLLRLTSPAGIKGGPQHVKGTITCS